MDSTVIAPIITGVFGLLAGLIPILYKWYTRPARKQIEGLGHFGKFVFSWMDLSESARKKLEQSQFIRIGGTRNALLTLVGDAGDNYSILAICGFKGSYSTAYYKKNFEKCKAVRRV